MAASFVRYLDAKNVLVPVYSAVRDSLSSSSPQSDRDILKAKVGGMSLDQVDADFVKWFNNSH